MAPFKGLIGIFLSLLMSIYSYTGDEKKNRMRPADTVTQAIFNKPEYFS